MNLQIVPLGNNILVDFKKQDIKNKIIQRIQDLKLEIYLYKTDNEFITLICNLVEYLVSKKDNINKKEMVISVFNDLFGLTSEEQENLKNTIDIIHLQNKIKKVSYWKLFKCGLSEFFFKKSKK